MSVIYLALFIVILVAYIESITLKRLKKISYATIMIFMWLLLVFRYGQGNDYFSYEHIYNACSNWNIALYNRKMAVHSEIGFRLLCFVFQGNYARFLFCISTLCMYMLHLCIKKHSENPLLTLLVFFPTGYFTYFFNLIRQGIIIAIFLGLMLEMLEKKKWKPYIVLAILLATIHTSALLFLIFPIILKIKYKNLLVIISLFAVIGLGLSTTYGVRFLESIPFLGNYLLPYLSTNISIMAFLERTITFLCVIILYVTQKSWIDTRLMKWVRIYIFGFGAYILFLNFDLISSRVMILFKILEIIIFPQLLMNKSRYRQLAILFLVMLCSVMLCKNLSSTVNMMGYKKIYDVNFLNYPYISVWDEEKYYRYIN